MLRLPARTTGYTVSRVAIPMRDGVELLADHYAPTGDTEPVGTLLLRGPYGRGFPFSLLYGALYAARGYRVLMQSVRGTFGSGGVFEPMVHEAADGADTVAWLRQQPWFTGRFATIGISYLGFTQWALLQDPPPELAAAVITAGPHDFSESAWGTGAFTVNNFLGWSYLVARQEEPGRIRAGIRQLQAQKSVIRAAGNLPLGAAGRELLGAGAPWWESWLEPPSEGNPFWDSLQFTDALDRVKVPVLLIGGWQDLFLQQTLQQYESFATAVSTWRSRSGRGPTPSSAFRVCALSPQNHRTGWTPILALAPPNRDRPGCTISSPAMAGTRQPTWPPATSELALYLRPGGGLTDTPPSSATTSAVSSVSFRYDPTDPTPTLGGRLPSPDGGYRDDTKLAARSDAPSFTTDALSEDLSVQGTPVAELAHNSDTPHV